MQVSTENVQNHAALKKTMSMYLIWEKKRAIYKKEIAEVLGNIPGDVALDNLLKAEENLPEDFEKIKKLASKIYYNFCYANNASWSLEILKLIWKKKIPVSIVDMYVISGSRWSQELEFIARHYFDTLSENSKERLKEYEFKSLEDCYTHNMKYTPNSFKSEESTLYFDLYPELRVYMIEKLNEELKKERYDSDVIEFRDEGWPSFSCFVRAYDDRDWELDYTSEEWFIFSYPIDQQFKWNFWEIIEKIKEFVSWKENEDR